MAETPTTSNTPKPASTVWRRPGKMAGGVLPVQFSSGDPYAGDCSTTK